MKTRKRMSRARQHATEGPATRFLPWLTPIIHGTCTHAFYSTFPKDATLGAMGVALLFLQLLFQVLRTRLSRSLVSVQSILLVHGIGKDHSSGFLVNHLYARGVIRVNLTKNKHLHRLCLLFLRCTCNHVRRSRLVGHNGQRSFLVLERSRMVGFV